MSDSLQLSVTVVSLFLFFSVHDVHSIIMYRLVQPYKFYHVCVHVQHCVCVCVHVHVCVVVCLCVWEG